MTLTTVFLRPPSTASSDKNSMTIENGECKEGKDTTGIHNRGAKRGIDPREEMKKRH